VLAFSFEGYGRGGGDDGYYDRDDYYVDDEIGWCFVTF